MSKRQEMRERRERQKNTQRWVLVGGGLLVVAVIAYIFISQVTQPLVEVSMPELNARPQASFNTMGDPNAPVKIIEYSDFQCPYCARFWQNTEPALVEAYVSTGKVYFEYRSVGLFLGAESKRAAEAAYCAGDQGKFWEMHDVIFANQGAVENGGAYQDARLVAFADELGLDLAQFKDCFNNNKYAARVDQDGLEASQAGVSATPSFLINGKLMEGAQPFAEFQKQIDVILAAAEQ